MRRSFDVTIVGGGPAGAAAALQLAAYGSERARHTLVLDAARFPREKLCGGGLVPESDRFLADLGLSTQQLDVPSVPIEEICFHYPGGRSVVDGRRFFHVVHRRAFDAALLRAAASRGIEVREGESAVDFERAGDRIEIRTEGGDCLDTGIVIGADGARSPVRKALVGSVRSDRFVALETLTPGHDAEAIPSRRATFDFRLAAGGLWGYAWDFPSLRDGAPWMNRGLAAGARSHELPLHRLFEHSLAERGVVPGAIEGAGAPFYDPARPQGSDRVLLAGDAVGIDPWFGEGISVALGTGILAAHAAAAGLARGRFDFAGHARRVAESAVGWSLERRRKLAEVFYALAAVPGGLAAALGGEVAA